MKVGFDYFPATTHAPGLGRYARELVRAIAQLEPADLKLELLDLGRGKRTLKGKALGLPTDEKWLRRRQKHVPRRLVNLIDRLLGFGADGWVGGCDVFHHSAPEPLLVEHAIEILPIPELPLEESEAHADLAERLKRIEHIVVFSEHYRTEVIRRFGWPTDRIHMTPVGCDHWVRDQEAPVALAEDPIILVLGALREDRYPHLIRRAFELVLAKQPKCRLVFCGRPGDAAEQFLRDRRFSGARNSIEWIDEPKESELPELVASASVLVHLSRDEGTPVTVLEGLRAGVPVVCSQLPAFEEVLGDIAFFASSKKKSEGKLAIAIESALASAHDQEARAARIALATPFSWENCARETLAVWNKVLETTPPRR